MQERRKVPLGLRELRDVYEKMSPQFSGQFVRFPFRLARKFRQPLGDLIAPRQGHPTPRENPTGGGCKRGYFIGADSARMRSRCALAVSPLVPPGM
jgi:hypothetical protein